MNDRKTQCLHFCRCKIINPELTKYLQWLKNRTFILKRNLNKIAFKKKKLNFPENCLSINSWTIIRKKVKCSWEDVVEGIIMARCREVCCSLGLNDEAAKATWGSHLDIWEQPQTRDRLSWLRYPTWRYLYLGPTWKAMRCFYQNLPPYCTHLAVMHVPGIHLSDCVSQRHFIGVLLSHAIIIFVMDDDYNAIFDIHKRNTFFFHISLLVFLP